MQHTIRQEFNVDNYVQKSCVTYQFNCDRYLRRKTQKMGCVDDSFIV